MRTHSEVNIHQLGTKQSTKKIAKQDKHFHKPLTECMVYVPRVGRRLTARYTNEVSLGFSLNRVTQKTSPFLVCSF